MEGDVFKEINRLDSLITAMAAEISASGLFERLDQTEEKISELERRPGLTARIDILERQLQAVLEEHVTNLGARIDEAQERNRQLEAINDQQDSQIDEHVEHHAKHHQVGEYSEDRRRVLIKDKAKGGWQREVVLETFGKTNEETQAELDRLVQLTLTDYPSGNEADESG